MVASTHSKVSAASPRPPIAASPYHTGVLPLNSSTSVMAAYQAGINHRNPRGKSTDGPLTSAAYRSCTTASRWALYPDPPSLDAAGQALVSHHDRLAAPCRERGPCSRSLCLGEHHRAERCGDGGVAAGASEDLDGSVGELDDVRVSVLAARSHTA